MKKFTFFASIALAMFMQSCGSSQQVATAPVNVVSQNQVQQDIEVALNPCEEYSLKATSQRAVGTGVHFRETTADNLAQLNARANLAKALQQCVQAATKNYADGKELFAADGESSSYVTDQSAGVADSEAGWAKELIKGAPVVMKRKYKTPDNQWRIYVCVEYQESVAEMAAKITKVFNEKLTQEQKARIDFNEQKFKQEMQEAMGDYKGVTEQ